MKMKENNETRKGFEGENESSVGHGSSITQNVDEHGTD